MGTLSLYLQQYADYYAQFLWLAGPTMASSVPNDLTGCTAVFEIREQPTDSAPLLSVSTTATSQGRILLGGYTGLIELFVARGAISPLPAAPWPQLGFTSFITSASGVVIPFLRGPVFVQPGYAHV